MVHSLARIGLLPNAPVENRKLAIDLIELIINWEKRRVTEAKAKGILISNLLVTFQ